MRMDFSTTRRVLFGAGIINQITESVRGWGKRALVVRGTNASPAEKVIDLLSNGGIECFHFQVTHEPTLDMVNDGIHYAREVDAQFVVSVGGGSAIDFGKAVSALMTNSGELIDYLEVVGMGKALINSALPMIAVPTTAGTGSEVTRNAVIGVPEKQVKVSLRSTYLIPQIALVDPELTLSLPRAVTASTGMDALTQLIEPFVTKKSNWMVDGFCRDGIARVAWALLTAFTVPSDLNARESMSYASLLSGMALANAGLGAAHGFAGPIGGMFDAPHGAVCAKLLPAVVRMNIHILKSHDSGPEILEKYREIAQLLTGKTTATSSDGIEWLQQLCNQLEIPGLKVYGIKPEHLDSLVEKAAEANSMKGNPVDLNRGEMRTILEQSL